MEECSKILIAVTLFTAVLGLFLIPVNNAMHEAMSDAKQIDASIWEEAMQATSSESTEGEGTESEGTQTPDTAINQDIDVSGNNNSVTVNVYYNSPTEEGKTGVTEDGEVADLD